MLIVDTNVLVAYVNSKDPKYDAACRAFERAPEAATSPMVMAEFDYFIRRRMGDSAARTAVRAVLADGLQIAEVSGRDLLHAVDVDKQYGDLGVGLTDAVLVLLAARFDTRTIATFDHRHFRAMRPLQGGEFRLVPDDLS